MENNDKYVPRHASKIDKEKLFSNRLSETKTMSRIELSKNKLEKSEEGINSDFWTGKVPIEKHEIKELKKKKKEKKKNNYIFVILIVFFLILMAFSGYKIYCWFMDNKKTSLSMDEINSNVDVLEVQDNDNTTLVSSVDDKDNPYWYYVKFPLIDVDISKLKKENSDIVGWINVNNTNVNYPFVQTTDNDFYLDHSIDKSSNEAGWLFLDYRNNSDLNNKNSIIYAHSRLDKSMFGSLSKVLKASWYNNKDNHIIRISLEGENSLWQIFSVYKIKTENYYITTYFSTDDEYMKFLDTISKRSLYNFNTPLNKDDRILTLSTCYSETERTVVHAKMIKKGIKE